MAGQNKSLGGVSRVPSTESKENIDNAILRELSMDARQSLGEIADKVAAGKTTVFNEINRLIKDKDIRFVPEINLEDLWRHELLYTTKLMQKRDLRHLDIHQIGFSEYVGFVKFIDKKPSDAEIIKAAGSSYVPQNIASLYGTDDLFMYLVARDHADINLFVNSFSRNLHGYKMVLRIRPIRKSFGFFPLGNRLIEQFKLPEKYKKLLIRLNGDARGQLWEGTEENRNAVNYIYKMLIEYGIISRTTMYMRNSDNNFIGIISYSIVDNQQFQKNRHKWLGHLVNMDCNRLGSYAFMADLYEPYGGLIIANAKNASCFEGIKRSLESLKLGIELESQVISHQLIGEIGIRNFDLKYSDQYGILAMDGIVPKLESSQYRTRKTWNSYIEL
ncbi:MAG: hypothetical protein QXF01_00195 [Candidatus Micrarchaeaceae archaeon]